MRKPTYDRSKRFRMYHVVNREGKSVKEVCRIFGISRKCYYRWNRIDVLAQRPNINFGSHNKKQPNTKLTQSVKELIEETKLKYNYGPVRMQLFLKKKLDLTVSTTVIYRFFKKKGLIRKPQKKLPWYQPMKQKLTVKQAGEGVQVDVKYVYEKSQRKYQFSIFDPYTMQYHFNVFDTKESKNSIVAFLNAQNSFGFPIISIQTDNGSEFRGCFHDWLTRRKIVHYFIPKKSPWWNCYVEQVHKTIDQEYYHNPDRIWKSPLEWLNFYNHERIHTTLKGLTPIEFYQKSVTLEC